LSISFRSLSVIVVIIAIYFGLERYDSPPRPPSLGPFRPLPVSLYNPKDGYQYGRYSKPMGKIDLSHASGVWSSFLSLKRWSYFSITNEKYFIGLLMCQLNYVANGFVYIVDRKSHQKFEISELSPLGLSVKAIQNDPRDGCHEWSATSLKIRYCYQSAISSYVVAVDALVSREGVSRQLQVNADIYSHDSLSLLYPITKDRPAYTHKEAAMKAKGTIKFGNERSDIMGLAALDFTHAYSERITKWKWASFSTFVSDATIGINFSDDVYLDNNGVSQENGVWVNGVSYLVGKVIFTLPSSNLLLSSPWKLSTNNTSEDVQINLTFQPHGSREEHINLLLISSNFVQPYGIFTGVISVKSEQGVKNYQIENVYGVMENHYAKW